jgi:hypothetical protein
MSLNLDASWLFLSLIPGGIGFVLFVYGKKEQRLPHLVAGILLMVYPYFTPTALSLFGVGAVICAVLWFGVYRLGW